MICLDVAIRPLCRSNPAATRYADGGVATNEYDAADRLVAARDPRGSRVALNLDIMGRATNRAASAWADFAWFDAAGCVTARVDAVSGRTVTRYDWLDRPLAVTDPAGRTTGFVYDPLDKVSVKVDPRGRATVYAYDAMGRPTSTAYPSGRSERSGYDALGRAASFVNAEGRVYRMGCDAQGRLLAATNAAGEQVVRNLYDFCGNLTNRTDGAGRNVRYRYDALNRGTNTVYADGSSEVFTYDAVGNLLTACNAAATNTFAYDSMNRLTSAVSRVSGQAFTVRYAYDLGGLATNIVYPDGKSVRYAYDADGRVTNVTDWAGHSFTFTRDAAGRVTSLAYPHVTGTYTYDAGHAVTSWSYGPANAPFAGRTITRDAAGLKTGETATGLLPDPASDRRADNTFDAADRLVSATVVTGSVTFAEAYRYDGCGSLTNVTRSGSAVPQAYAYDLAGRMVSAAATNLSLAVAYDAIGNRVRTVSGGVTRLWVTDHTDPLKRPLMETDAAGAPVRYYLWGGGKFLAVVEADGATHYAHSDELGSVVALTDGDGAVTDRYCYGPYGQDWGHSGTNSIPFRWLGSHGVLAATYLSNSSLLTPHSSLYLTRHRAYDAELGRFISADPSGLGGGPNLYAYGLGNPLAYIDPLGLCGYDQYHSTISADTRPASGYYQKEIMYDPDADPGSRALYHADQLMPEAYVGTEMGDRWVSDRYQTAANIAAAEFVVSEAVGAFATKAFRYVSESEATIAERSGFVPNVTQAGTPKNVFYSPERFTGSSAAEDALRIGSKNPLGPTVAPTHRITVDASGANWGYGGSVEGAPGVELITTKQLRVLSVDPLGR